MISRREYLLIKYILWQIKIPNTKDMPSNKKD